MADQCITWSRDAPNTAARNAYLILARVWLTAAAQEEALPNGLPLARTLGCNGQPFLGRLKDRPKASPTTRPPR